MTTNKLITVIIPYYQTEEGVLRETVITALNQKCNWPYEIIVVDDEAPVSAYDELHDLLVEHRDRLRIIRQKNSGAGAARNMGIDNVRPDTEYIAFLDSDDSWYEHHLENAIAALEYGYDFYFADFYFPDYKEKSAFKRAGKIRNKEHRCIDRKRKIYEYNGDMIDQILVKGNVIGTSTVVYRYAKYKEIRFREEYFNGQDYLFWLDISQSCDKFCYSANIDCNYRPGVNIYSGAKWGTDRLQRRLRNELFLWISVTKIYNLTSVQKKSLKQRIAYLRRCALMNILHLLKKNVVKSSSMFVTLVMTDKKLIFLSPFIFATLIIHKVKH